MRHTNTKLNLVIVMELTFRLPRVARWWVTTVPRLRVAVSYSGFDLWAD